MSVKAFELVSCIEVVQLTGDKVPATIHCMEYSEDVLFVGVGDGFIVRYHIVEGRQNDGIHSFSSTWKGQKCLGLKKSVVILKAASALDLLLALCDGVMFILSMASMEQITVSGSSKLKGVAWFSVNENPLNSDPFVIQVCLAKKKQLQIYAISQDKVTFVHDVALGDQPLLMAVDGRYVCTATMSQYLIIDWETGHQQELFPYDVIITSPLVRRINKEEFLVGGPNALGMFVTTAGTSERPPLPWKETVHAAAYLHPYIITMDRECVTIYSILDQKQKQSVRFNSGMYLDNLCGRIFLASLSSVYILFPVPWEKQVQALLEQKRVPEALELAQNANWAGLTKDQFLETYRRFQQQAGFIEFKDFHFDEAAELFRDGHLDVRELVSLFPELVPSSSTFSRSRHLHEATDIHQICRGDQDKLLQCKGFLLKYLELEKERPTNVFSKEEICTTLLKLYAELDPSELVAAAMTFGSLCQTAECESYLLQFGRFHALALLHHHQGDYGRSLETWSQLLCGVVADEFFPGLPFFVEVLSNLKDDTLVWKYADFVLDLDQEMGAKVFTDRPLNDLIADRMNPEKVLAHLQRCPQATVLFLEHLVWNCNVEKEEFHTHLAVAYLEHVQKLLKEYDSKSEAVTIARFKLQRLIFESSHFRVHYLLGQIRDSQLLFEMAILHGKLEEHRKALRILVHQLKDYVAAEEYCIRCSKSRDKSYRQELFLNLLNVYLDPNLGSQDQELLFGPAIRLLNSELADFDAFKVLELIPNHWSTTIVEQFLSRALRNSLHLRRMHHIQQALARVERVQATFAKYDLERERLLLTTNRACFKCGHDLVEPKFMWLPDGRVAHVHCVQTSVPASSLTASAHHPR